MSSESLPFGGSGLKGDSLCRRGTSRRGKGLAGVAKAVSRQGSCRGSPLRPFCSSWSWPWHCSVLLSFGLTLAHLPCLAWCGGARGSDCPCTVIGVQKVYPSFCTPTVSDPFFLLVVLWPRCGLPTPYWLHADDPQVYMPSLPGSTAPAPHLSACASFSTPISSSKDT